MDKTYIIDLDGTMYHGSTIIKEAKQFIHYLIRENKKFVFLTNNATRTRKQNKEHMITMGFEHITEEHFFTSSMAASKFIANHYEKKTCFYIGEEGLKESLLKEGFTINEKEPAFVFVGLDHQANYELYTKALQFLMNGSLLVGTNADRRLPSDQGYKVGNGAILEMLCYASNAKVIHIGKPYTPILDECLTYYNLQKEDVILIGDNLETDILLGVNANVETIFVTTGVHSKQDIQKLQIHPTHTISSLSSLITY